MANMNREILKGFIVIEGLDGSGTTTQLNNISAYLEKKNTAFVRTHEPTDMDTGLLIRKVLSGKIPLEQETIAYLFAADRNQHINGKESGIRDLLKTHAYVISDRYHFSSIAYQSIGGDAGLVKELNSRFPLPEYLIFIDVPLEECQRRMAERNSGKDIYDAMEVQKKVLNNYNDAIDYFSDSEMKVCRIDGLQSPEAITSEIIDKVFSL